MATPRDKQLAVNATRVLSIDQVQQANSGHPGLPLGAAPMAFELWSSHMKHNPADPKWLNRDRFILSAGHGSALLYSLLHLFGYGLTIDDLKQFRQLGSRTPGHPEYHDTPGVEATTGPLGQGVAMAAGMALAGAHLGARFNKPGYELIDHYTYALVGDGCLQEGISSESASIAGTLKLGRLIVLYDFNRISIDGDTSVTFSEDSLARYRAYNWQVLEVADANDTEAIGQAIEEAKANLDQPTLIAVHSTIGYGSPLAGSEKTHGAPLGEDGVAATRAYFDWDSPEPFAVPEAVYDYMDQVKADVSSGYDDWQALYQRYLTDFPELADELKACTDPDYPITLPPEEELYAFEGSIATRKTSETVLNRLAPYVPNLIGGSADLAGSNNTTMKSESWLSPDNYQGRNIHFGVREFNTACMVNGMALHSGLRPYGATFLVFSDYSKPALRLAAIMNTPSLFIFTHDSIGVGEDGPTHQPIEQLTMLRATPGLYVWRPADGPETAAAYEWALTEARPTVLALTRQNLPTFAETGRAALRGGYVLRDNTDGETPELILLASGSEVSAAAETYDTLAAEGTRLRLVSIPCMDLFLEQDAEYQEQVLPADCRKRVAMEAGAPESWYRFTGLDGKVIGMTTFGASGKGSEVFEHFGITADAMTAAARELLTAE